MDLFLDRFSIDAILNWPANHCRALLDVAPFVIDLLDAGGSIDRLLELPRNELHSFLHNSQDGILVLLKNKKIEFNELLKLAQEKAPIVRYSETTMKALLDEGLSLQQILDLPKDLQKDFRKFKSLAKVIEAGISFDRLLRLPRHISKDILTQYGLLYKKGLTQKLFKRGISPETLAELPIPVYEEFKRNTNVIVLMLENGTDFDKIVELPDEKRTALFKLLTKLGLMCNPREDLFEKGMPLIDLFDLPLDKLKLLDDKLMNVQGDDFRKPGAVTLADFIKATLAA